MRIYLLTVFLAASCFADDWPNFLGPTQNNHCSEELRLDWTDGAPEPVFRIKTGDTYSAPVIAKGILISFHRLENTEVVDAHDAVKGTLRWRYTYPTAYQDMYGYNNGPRASALIHEDQVYTWGAEGVMSCLNLADGKLIWQRKLNADYRVKQNFFGVGSAPVIDGNVVLANVGGETENTGIVGLDKLTGKTLWQSGDHKASYGTPVVHDINGKRTAVFFTRRGLLTADPTTGTLFHDYFFRSKKFESVNAACPVVFGDTIFLSATYGTGAVALKVTDAGLQEVWKDEDAMQTHWNTCVLHDGFLYGSTGRHESESVFRCIEFATGKIRWSSPRGYGRSNLLRVGDRFLALGERGILAVLEVNPNAFVEKHRAMYTGYPSWAPPVPANGYVYVRDTRNIVCLDVRKK